MSYFMTNVTLHAVEARENELGRPLSNEEKYNLTRYGALSPQEFEPEYDELKPGQCICGAFDCDEEYAHWTSGW